MIVRVITPADPIVTPADIAGGHAATDARIAAMIAAVTEEIDGPTGWLGRCLGPQTLELTERHCHSAFSLPYPPIIEIVSVKYTDLSGVEHELNSTEWVLDDECLAIKSDFPNGVKKTVIRYKAGYDGSPGIGNVPQRAKQAIILSVQHMKSLAVESLFLRSDEVEGVGTKQYTVSDQAGVIIREACDRLLSGLRIYVL